MNEIKVEFGEGVIEGLASIGIDAKQEVQNAIDNMQPTIGQNKLAIGNMSIFKNKTLSEEESNVRNK